MKCYIVFIDVSYHKKIITQSFSGRTAAIIENKIIKYVEEQRQHGYELRLYYKSY